MSKKLLAAIAAVVIIGGCLFLAARTPDKGTDVYEVVFFGDSNIVGFEKGHGIPEAFAEMTGKTVLNAGFGGSMMSSVNERGYGSDVAHFFNMYELSKCLRRKDFTITEIASLPDDSLISRYIVETAGRLGRVDWDKVQYVIIEHCVNDYSAGVPIEDETNPDNPGTFCGAVRKVVRNVRKALPNAVIILETPTYSTYQGDKDVSLEDYVEAELKVAKELGVYVCDCYHLSGVNEGNAGELLYDSVHLKQEGALLAADVLTKVFDSIEDEK